MDLKKFLWRLLLDCSGWTSEMNITGISELDAAIPEWWSKGVITDGDRESFWGSLTGKEGSMMPVIMKTGQLKEAGDLIHFQCINQLMGSGVTGESVLKGTEEKLSIGTFTVSADVLRHAVAIGRKATKQAYFESVQLAGKLLKSWIARKMDTDCFNAFLTSSSLDTLYANSRTTEASLVSTDGFGIAEIEMIRMALIRSGATPLSVNKVNGRSQPIFGIAYGEIEEYNLSQNSIFVQAIREAWERFKGNGDHPLFRGAVGIYRNMVLYPYYSQLSIPQGTPLRPESLVSVTLTTTATTLTVGGSTATPNYTEFFASSGSLQIEDEIISYSSKTVNTFAGLTRAAGSTTAAQHIPNKLVTQRNIATVIGFGAEAVFKALPEDVETIGDKDDFGEQVGLGVRAYYGQKLRVDARRAKCPSAVLMKVYSQNPGTV